jgi:hypothetical protein
MSVNKAFLASSLLGIAIAMTGPPDGLRAQQNQVQQATNPAIYDEDIGGVVTSKFGPEAGVWVIAETTDLGTRFAKMAVTDERGRYVVPDLPRAKYKVWVRGYDLVDSPKVATEPGRILSRQSRNQRGDSIVHRCQSCREPDDGVAHGAL